MADPQLAGIAAPPEELAVDAVLATLRDDPTIGSGGAEPFTVLAPEGDREWLPEVAVEPDSTLPIVRLVLLDEASRWESATSHRAILRLLVQVFTAGTHYGDRFRAIAALRSAIYPQDAARELAVRARLNEAGALSWTLKSMGSKPLMLGDDQHAQRVEMALEILFDNIPT